MKKTILIALISGIVINSYSQQIPLYTQYMFNDFIINPAIAGTHDYFQAKSNNRYQWAGLVDHPFTAVLSVYGPFMNQDMGYGGYIFSDVTGPTSRTGLYGSYGYNIKVDRDIRLSFGLSLGLLQYKIDGTKIEFLDEELTAGKVQTAYLPDANIGVYVYASNYYGGISAHQLLNNRMSISSLENGQSEVFNRLRSHFFLHGGYKYNIDHDFDLEPTLLFKYVYPTPPQVDISCKVIYQKMVWGALSYRTGDALAVMAGYNHMDKFYFGLAYDITTSKIRKTNAGTFELMVSAKFNKIKNTR